MELNDLKKVWQDSTDNKVRFKELDTTKINEMLVRRGTGILSRLDRSVRIVLWFLVIFFLITLLDQLLPTDLIFPENLENSMDVPKWIGTLEWIVNLTLMTTILLFVFRYRQLQVHTLASQDLKGAIRKVLIILDTFKKGFYLAVIILTAGIGLGFLTGVHQGFESIRIIQTPTVKSIILVVVSVLFLLCLLIGSIFYIFHKGFNLLFGKYRDQLIQSLNELQENEE